MVNEINRKEEKHEKIFGAKPYLFPQPVMIIGTYEENGKPNARNAARGRDEIIVDLSAHKTADNNILKTKAFTVSMGDLEHLAAYDAKKLK